MRSEVTVTFKNQVPVHIELHEDLAPLPSEAARRWPSLVHHRKDLLLEAVFVDLPR